MEDKRLKPEKGKETNTLDTVVDDTIDDSESADDLEEKQINEVLETDIDPETDLRNELVAAQAQAAEYLDGWQRARAEFANARKRLEKQRSEAYQNAASDFTQKLLPILDDFGRAIDSAPEEIENHRWYEGIELVHKKLVTLLENMNVEPIEAIGEVFDPNMHEALALVQAEGVESGVIVEEIQVGYRMGDRIIRPSLVNVAA